VADFGIAREVEAAAQTMTGLTSGTPLYMAPAQARGDTRRLDRRTDVYSMGATLYELCAGRPPFVGNSAAGLILSVVHDEAPPLRKVEPTVPVDLETITMKCLEKDPGRRYETARALAEDLERYLDGEPIQARRRSVTYRLSSARKHLGLVVAGLAALAVAVTAGAVALSARKNAAAQARMAHQFGRKVKRSTRSCATRRCCRSMTPAGRRRSFARACARSTATWRDSAKRRAPPATTRSAGASLRSVPIEEEIRTGLAMADKRAAGERRRRERRPLRARRPRRAGRRPARHRPEPRARSLP
jgi:hypothetical protein